MRFEIQYKRLNIITNNTDCDIEFIMKILELQYKGLAVIMSLKCDSKQLDIESLKNNLVF